MTVAVVLREQDRDCGHSAARAGPWPWPLCCASGPWPWPLCCASGTVAVAVVLRERTVTGIYGYGRNKAELRKRLE